jgi:hypothetical protein
LHPAADGGFAAFPASSGRPEGRSAVAFPATRFHTPRRTPLADSRAASPRPLPSCRSSSAPPAPTLFPHFPPLRAEALCGSGRWRAPPREPARPAPGHADRLRATALLAEC